MKYIRTKDNCIFKLSGGDTDIEKVKESYVWCYNERFRTHFRVDKDFIIKQANTIEELIQIGDIVFYWQQSDNTERCEIIVREDDIRRISFFTITKLLVPNGDGYKLSAKANSIFEKINGQTFLVERKKLELL